MRRDRLQIAVIGLGPWGRNLLRAFAQAPRCSVVAVCDTDPSRLANAELSGARRESSLHRILSAPDVDAVVVATPARTHAAVGRAALEAEKHVFLEKPMALSVRDAVRLVATAQARDRRLMVGHVLEHHPGVLALSQLIAEGRLGHVHKVVSYRFVVSATREEGSWWSLAPHDISLARRFLGREPSAVLARHQAMMGGETITARLHFGSGSADIHVGSGHLHKIRRTLVVGTRAVAELDDCRQGDKLRLAESNDVPPDAFSEGLTSGSVVPLPHEEPLAREAAAFVRGVLDGTPFFGDGASALQVTAALAAGDLSLSLGHAVAVTADAEPSGTRIAAAP